MGVQRAPPGRVRVEAVVGCGAGSGGSTVEFAFPGRTLGLTVPVTGGFQDFRVQELGRVTIDKAGRTRLEVRRNQEAGCGGDGPEGSEAGAGEVK